MDFFELIFVSIVWLFIFSSIDAINDENCGKPLRKVSPLIIGGTNASKSQYPFMVHLGNCGATIIDKRWVLTAAHCIHGTSAENHYFIWGTEDLNEIKAHMKVKASLVVVNGCMKAYSDYSGDNDIALIKASTDLIDPHTICLPEQNAEPSNKNVIITGWGKYQKYGKSSTKYLQVAETELFPEEFCNYMIEFTNIGFIRFSSDGTKVCVYSESNAPCSGDSGGPVFEMIDGRAVQVGLTSHSTNNFVLEKYGYRCFKGNPEMYTKVSAFRDWIDAVVREFDDKNINGVVDTECEPIDKNTKIKYKVRQQTEDKSSKKREKKSEKDEE